MLPHDSSDWRRISDTRVLCAAQATARDTRRFGFCVPGMACMMILLKKG